MRSPNRSPRKTQTPPANGESSCSQIFASTKSCHGSGSLSRSLFGWVRRMLPVSPRSPSTTLGERAITVDISDERSASHPSPSASAVAKSSPPPPPCAAAATSARSAPSAVPASKHSKNSPSPTSPSPPTAMASASQMMMQRSPGQMPSPSRSAAPNDESLPPTQPSSPIAAKPSTPAPAQTCAGHKSYVIGGMNFEVDVRYKIKTLVGKGAYGLVAAAEDLSAKPEDSERAKPPPAAGPPPAAPPSGKRMVAVKKVIDPFHDHTDCKRLLREIRLLRSLRHPNVLHLTDIMPPSSRSPDEASWKDVYLVTRLFDTNLHRVIYSGHALTDAHVQYVLWQVFRALRYLHSAGVVHRDMKPTNLLLNRDCELALADFGLARADVGLDERTKAKGGQLTKYVVTRWYRAPELLVQNKQYDCKVDMWSVGCILAELLGAKAMFPGKDSLHQLRLVVDLLGIPSADEMECIQNVQAIAYIKSMRPKDSPTKDGAPAEPTPAERFSKLFPRAPPLLLDLLARLLQFDPRKRPSASEALAHPYLASYRDAPEEGLPTPEIDMGFEKDNPTTHDLRMLIWEEVLRYHPHLREGGAASVSAAGGAAAAAAANGHAARSVVAVS